MDSTNESPEPAGLPVDLLSAAKAVLSANDHGNFTMPNSQLYPHQWLWDSCFIAIGLRHIDVDRATVEIKSLLRGQWANGMIPNMIITPKDFTRPDAYRHHGNVWRSWMNPAAPDGLATSGITQPPMLAEAILQIGGKMKMVERRSWYKTVYPALLDYHRWLYDERDPHGEGLVLLIHPWESGLDNTPPWMHELHEHLLPWWIRLMERTGLATIFGWFRRDNKYVRNGERLSNVDALALYDVQRRLRRKRYDFSRIIDHSLFAIEDLTFNCILIRANSCLKQIAQAIKQEIPEELADSMQRTEKALEQLWQPFAGEYFSRDFVSHRLLQESSIATLMPLYAGCITKDRASQLVNLIENEHRYGPAYPVPSTPLDSPWFRPQSYWQGPTWVNTNWLIIEGLKRYGFTDHAAALKESTLEMIEHGGFYEYFDPLNGAAYGTPDFSWTAALAIDLKKQKI